MRFFIDTNVLYDLNQNERPSYEASTKFFKASIKGKADLVITSASVMTIIYSLQRYKIPYADIVSRMSKLVLHFTLADVSTVELIAGINSGWKDIEDAIQFNAALSAGQIDAIVSNDKDFKQQRQIKVVTPAQALKLLK